MERKRSLCYSNRNLICQTDCWVITLKWRVIIYEMKSLPRKTWWASKCFTSLSKLSADDLRSRLCLEVCGVWSGLPGGLWGLVWSVWRSGLSIPGGLWVWSDSAWRSMGSGLVRSAWRFGLSIPGGLWVWSDSGWRSMESGLVFLEVYRSGLPGGLWVWSDSATRSMGSGLTLPGDLCGLVWSVWRSVGSGRSRPVPDSA